VSFTLCDGVVATRAPRPTNHRGTDRCVRGTAEVKSDGDAGGAMSIRGSGRVVASLSGPAEDVADNGPARRQRFLDLTQHPIFVKPVDRAVALGIEEPGI
jgi:hypothetical protein